MKSLTRTITWILIGGAIGVFLATGQGVFAERNSEGTLPLEDLRTFTEVFAKIKDDYVEPIGDKVLLENAIRGMLSGLDPHSSYLVPDRLPGASGRHERGVRGPGNRGRHGGRIRQGHRADRRYTRRNAPASRRETSIIRLDDTPVKGHVAGQDAVKVMRGEPGTDIVLTIVREGQDRPLRITITRDVIQRDERTKPLASSRDSGTSGSASSSSGPARACARRSASCARTPGTTG